MITSDLTDYIKSQLNKSNSKDSIISKLLQVGWKIEDIEEGFLVLEASKIRETVMPEEQEAQIDPYRELPEGVEMEKVQTYHIPVVEPKVLEIQPREEPKKTEEIKEEEEIVFSAEKEVEPYKFEVDGDIKPTAISSGEDRFRVQPFEEPKKIEEIKEEKETIISNNKEIEKVKIWTPTTIEVKPPELVSIEEPKKVEPVKAQEIYPSLEFIPTLNNNSPINPPSQSVGNPRVNVQGIKAPVIERSMSDMTQKNAMISSYSQDILAAKKEEPSPTIKKNSFLKFGIIIFISSVILGMGFAFVEGYIKIPWSNISLSVVKKDPKTIMLNAPLNISKLKSYKVETNISISSPSLSSITTGLSSGEVVTSKDRESMSFLAKGSANHSGGKLIFDYLLSFKSSLLEEDINSNLKYDGEDLYVVVPDLGNIIGKDSPDPTTVSLKPNQINLITPELSLAVQDKIKEFDIYNIMSGEVPTYVKNEVTSIFKEFIGKLEYSEKEEEKIHGIDTYHYELTAGRLQTKKFLTSLANLFIVKITQEQKKDIEEALGSSSISSFEVWIGKNDNNLYQIKFTLNTPLSKVLGLNDSGIADNEVKLDWVTTYYDLDVENNISIPNADLNMDGFIKNIKDIKTKNIISSFKPQSVSFKNAVGSFGSRSNPTGSCTNPNPGSIFSPKGHVKGADGAISSIATSMNSLLLVTSGAGSCYSTSQAWALAAPLISSDPSAPSFYCSDNTGAITTITAPITKPSCK